MKLTLGFSPCPNDTFIFDALVNKKIDTDGIEFDVMLEDVETLNQWALQGKLDITKLSFPAFFKSLEHYVLLSAGSALGKGVGPILISRNEARIETNEISNKTIALPGENTTANLLFSFAYPSATQKKYILFSEIENAVLNNEVDLGVIIHENRFTYADKGLNKVIDLGEYWEQQTNLPIPLGGIAINQSVKRSLALKIQALINQSVEYAFANYPQLPAYVTAHAQEMSEDVMRQHIDLYVNDFSIELGDAWENAILSLYETFAKINAIEMEDGNLFL